MCLTARSQQYIHNNELSFDLLTMGDGLSQNSINCIFQDKKGFLWIGTKSGLNRYDGKNVLVYKNEPLDENSLSDNSINSIVEDHNGNLWIGTEYGLNKFLRESGHFETIYKENDTKYSISDNRVYNLLVDKKGYIWVKTLKSLDRIDPVTGIARHFEHFFDIFNPIAENCNYPVFQTSYGDIYVGTNDGLCYFDEKYEQFVRFFEEPLDKNSISNNEIRCIFEDKKHNLWIGTSNGLNLFNPRQKTFVKYFYLKDKTKGNVINSIEEGVGGDIWIATSRFGLCKFKVSQGEFSFFSDALDDKTSVVSNDINSLFIDKSNILWVGTRSGLNKLDLKKKKFNLYRTSSTLQFTSNDITSLFVIDEDLLLLGTRNDGLNLYDRKNNKVSIYTETNGRIFSNEIFAITNFGKEILIGTGDGVYIFEKNKPSLHSFFTKYPCVNKALLNGKRITALMTDSKGILWIGTNIGLFCYKRRESTLVSYHHNVSDNSTISSNIVTEIFEDGNGNIWVGTDFGLNRFEAEAEMFERITYEKNSNQGLSHNMVYSINEDTYGNLWVGTGAGLDMYDKRRGVFTYYTERDGLPNNQIYSIVKWANNLWITTNKGLAMFSIETGNFKSYDVTDGLQGYEFNPNSFAISHDGEIFLGGVSGFNSFYADSVVDNSYIPNTVITAVNVYGGELSSNYFVEDAEKIVLPYKNHSFRVEFASLEFTQPLKNSYEYMMEGLDDEWINIGNTSYENFSNIPSGEYLFKIRSSNNDKVWNDEPATLQIIIETPIWKRGWAYVIYVLLFLLGLYSIIEFRTKKLKKANRVLLEKQQAALEIAKQKEELAIKNKNITDSITYAKRIQWAIMPSRKKFSNLLPESFILYMPKDIVSGDFYWITEIEDKIFIASVDCTGHGVPGAFMSIIGFDLLRNITKERNIHKPSDVLDELNKSLVALLTKNIIVGEVKDGMDLALCVFHKDKGILEFSGALNPLYIIRNNKIMTIRGDRFSVGLGNEHANESFKNHIVKLQHGDRVYVFSDGYADQFGGPNGKKMKYRRFRHLLLSIHNLPFDRQCEYLEHHFHTWKGQLEQLDDILILGMSFDSYLEKM